MVGDELPVEHVQDVTVEVAHVADADGGKRHWRGNDFDGHLAAAQRGSVYVIIHGTAYMTSVFYYASEIKYQFYIGVINWLLYACTLEIIQQ